MSTTMRLMSYPEERVLEHAAYVLEAVPTRIYLVLLPVWCVEVQAEVTAGEPYELIDRFLERGIAEAGLDTADDLASFFALEPPLVAQALRFLTAIGHIKWSRSGRLQLTELGQRSVRDNRRYTVTRKDRRRLYFDAFACRPLTRPYYDERKVTFLSWGAAQEVLNRRDGPRTHIFSTTHGFRREALAELADHPERDRYNLPERIDRPESLNEELAFLPTYVVRAVGSDGRARHLVYTQAADEADVELTAVCQSTPEITSALEAEEVDAAPDGQDRDFQDRVARWLSTRNLGQHQPVRGRNGGWRVTLPGGSFGANRAVPLTKLGSFVVLGTSFFHLWCSDERVRRKALLERLDAYLGARGAADRNIVIARIDLISRQLDLGAVSLQDLWRAAASAGRQGLADQLARLG
ncbi:hypothetical protein [Streptomyces sp. 8N616]|uniref:hypothetical protein n=1 Tax=Streptomyces sp. 8N616 TaxID=3457414 RepID=UPI003FD68B8C